MSNPDTAERAPVVLNPALAYDRSPPKPDAPTPNEERWSNVHAPDAMRATTASAETGTTSANRALRVFLRNPNAMTGLIFLVLVVAAALLAPVLYPEDPLSMVARPFIWPGTNSTYPLGTDSLGRDVLSGILHGARISLLVGIVATVIGLAVGLIIGSTAGYFGGWVDDVLVKLIEIVQTLPSFILLVVLVAIAQPSVAVVTGAVGIVSWPTVARLVRSEFRAIREKDYVVAARSLGYGHVRIIIREILPNALPPIIVTSSVMVASAILMESALSFMGLGDPNLVSWGSMIGDGRELLRTAWYLTAIPGLAIVFTVLALNLIGDGLNDALNPRFTDER
ncbi:ABC transporter permease [Kaistia dalseonensis]|uniref:Peptide/nickel transport system permease protein n=1 Tax=Kaistia dalseonensis TaxID=410840 RepID=A0ABU0H2Y8_9HYPH|nr:ABC transporter permease [Kaistia dalseonensis]MCX5493695.1 ABC transporter permease [Kaistia dalseonensis]MDQ0436258.1 peptide/nickel transport system permease protein [Kaistia dalseonensis]